MATTTKTSARVSAAKEHPPAATSRSKAPSATPRAGRVTKPSTSTATAKPTPTTKTLASPTTSAPPARTRKPTSPPNTPVGKTPRTPKSASAAKPSSTSAAPASSTPASPQAPLGTSSPPAQLSALQAAQQELAARILAKRRLIPFTQRINPRYTAGWVHRDIARRLEQFSLDVANGLSPRLMILMPPRAGKSELASRMFPAWHLGHYPDHELISCAYNVSLAESFSRKVKEAMEDPSYQNVFATRLHPDFRSNGEWALANGRGGYVAAGVGGGINGKGAHILLIDDPIKNAEEADSADTREKLWDWYGSTAYTRLAPGGGVLIIQTWWHDDDLAGRLQNAMAGDDEADQFVVVKYPAIAEHDEWLDHDTDLIHYVSHAEPNPVADQTVELDEGGRIMRDALLKAQATARAATLGVDVSNMTFQRAKGEALHPERFDIAKLNRIKRTIPPRFWAALYQQNPVPDDGAYFLKEHFRRGRPPLLRESNIFVAFDFAISEKKQNDYTVGVVGLQDSDDVLHVVDMVRFKSGDGMFIVEAILNLCQKWYSPHLQLGFEDGQIFRAIETLLKKRMRERKFYPSSILLKPISDKMARARPLQGRMQQGMVSFSDVAEWFDGARAEMLRFPAGVHDDQVDALAWMATMAVNKEPPRKSKSKEPKSWRDKLSSLSGSYSHMAA